MRRRYLTDWYANRIYEIKKRIPSAGIGLDVIAGFPGETIELFNETYRFLVDLPISYLHVFTYSERPNTAAIQMLNHIEPRIKFERSEMLRNLSAKKRRQFNETFVGKIVNVLFESEEKSGLLSGLIDEYVRVNVKGNVEMKGEIVPVRITGYDSNGCTGICEDEIKTSVFSKQRSTLRMTQCN
jgi:threonylcarbamoyladenosine tRNA methylthiotransferase MtaB